MKQLGGKMEAIPNLVTHQTDFTEDYICLTTKIKNLKPTKKPQYICRCYFVLDDLVACVLLTRQMTPLYYM